MKNFILSFAVGLLSLTLTAQNTTPVGTSKNWGSVDGISMIGLVQGPSSADANYRLPVSSNTLKTTFTMLRLCLQT